MPPRPASEWPNRPVEKATLLGDPHPPEAIDTLPIERPVRAIWGSTFADVQRQSITAGDVDASAVVDLVIETPSDYQLYSYTHHDGTTQWVSYDSEQKGTEGADRIERLLDEYSFYSGDPEIEP
ncbi:hypothetical protein [Halocatena halophila]|uniref:hypothetical protein n=1 Tax=Halocatena halophila TaxID=2814576 RepID=UPI002ED6ABF2